ncbi:Dolichyl-phosphate-mannose-protein mannosyltransferase-domain-containing protein [Microdochium bolleyi]|uniref:Dolichyl-phosphate-mannose--protein mannosyltransferase n=1 Tax=Microdochium bolleyi TaxID=196109 RepID=A0A136IWW2_9PEZI|nr:Dolichyl-phosphate-mannose-protein mannosyltransferase-domain-containing protein [Microdochium bolleyi]
MGRSNSARPPSSRNGSSTAVVATNAKSKNVAKRNDYGSDGVEDNDVFLLPGSDFQVLALVTIIGAVVRLFRIYQPTSVVFDEVHFGGFATKYIKGKFFMDVHPPLAKLMITLFGWLAGFKGDFDFKEIGKDYIEPGVPYVAMRMYPAICGILLVPIVFLTLKAAGCRTPTAALGASLIIFENGLLTQARLILLDAPLVAATAFTALSWISFSNQHEQGPAKAFQPAWWFWLTMSGLGMGITLSIKWVGLFTYAWVGCLTLVQLWVLLGDAKTVTMRLFAKHFLARAFCLIIIPISFYMAMFAIHFLCLVNPGDGDGFMSSEFQATLNSKGMQDTPADVAFGSRVAIRHVNTQGGYLHSHPLMYPGGSQQQQITLYPHKDSNNIWLLENQTQPLDVNGLSINGTDAWDKLTNITENYITDGSVLRLYHTPTFRRLHSHDVRPPVSEQEWQNEVSCYGYEGFEGDANDLFRVEIVKGQSASGVAKTRLRTIETKFRLVHVMTGCALFSHKVKLPDWASEQQEVTCAKQGSMPNSVWYVESNDHPALGADAEKVNYRKPGFLGKFWEIQKVMWRTNAGLVDSHAWDSRPDSWPILRRGINFWGRNHRQIYLIGNPIIWYTSTLAVVIYVLFKALAVLRWQRSCGDYSNTTFKRFDYEIGTSVLGWALHYFPFYLMQRQLFLHHYFPALVFAIMAFCQIFDFITARFSGPQSRPLVNKFGAIAFLTLSAAAFALYSPLAYGNTWTKAECQRVKLFDTWDWDCNNFLENYADYDKLANSPPPQAVPTAKPSAVQAQQPPAQDVVSGAPKLEVQDQQVMKREESVEYRDQDGNLLNEEQVKALAGKVEFRTKYETRTRVLDAAGNQIDVIGEDGSGAGVAPPHPDVEGANSETKQNRAAEEPLKEASSSKDGEKEAEHSIPKPASEGNEATVEADAA